MNAVHPVCVPSDPDWQEIDWSRVKRQFKRLQERIVKATQDRRYGKVKALPWLLTHSFSGRSLSVKRVTENRGKYTSASTTTTGKHQKQKPMPYRR
jgi:RNA-directed DNA polymerase